MCNLLTTLSIWISSRQSRWGGGASVLAYRYVRQQDPLFGHFFLTKGMLFQQFPRTKCIHFRNLLKSPQKSHSRRKFTKTGLQKYFSLTKSMVFQISLSQRTRFWTMMPHIPVYYIWSEVPPSFQSARSVSLYSTVLFYFMLFIHFNSFIPIKWLQGLLF